MIKALLALLALLVALAVLATLTPKLEGQAALPNWRAEQEQAEQVKKAAVLVPDEPHGAERVFNKGQDIAGRLFYGYPFRLHYCCRISNLPIGSLTTSVAPLELAGLPNGSGIAIGPFAEWRSSSDLSFNLYGAVSVNGSYLGAAGLHQHLPGQSLRISVQGAYANAKRIDFYGEGADSVESNRTLYRREETSDYSNLRPAPKCQLPDAQVTFRVRARFTSVPASGSLQRILKLSDDANHFIVFS